MKALLDFAQGKMSYDDFELYQLITPEVWDEIQDLITDEIMTDETKCFSKSNRDRLIAENYSVKAVVFAFGYSYGKYLAFSIISELVKYYNPEVTIKEPPDFGSSTLLEKLNLDFLGGENVDDIIDDILSNPIGNNAKGKNASYKVRLKEAFHLDSRKRPHWAQEPEWPMGCKSPMKFIQEQQIGDKVELVFADVDTGERVVITQLY